MTHRQNRLFLKRISRDGGYGSRDVDATSHLRSPGDRTHLPPPNGPLDPLASVVGRVDVMDDLARLSWVFAHGSLMFDADFAPETVLPGRAWGWERRFGQPSVRNWGTNTAPAPTSSLSRGSHCDGLLLGLPSGNAGSVLASLAQREANEPVTVSVSTEFGDVSAFTWLMSDSWARLDAAELAVHGVTNVRAGGGPRGDAWHYAAGVHAALSAHGLRDDLVTRYVEQLGPQVGSEGRGRTPGTDASPGPGQAGDSPPV